MENISTSEVDRLRMKYFKRGKTADTSVHNVSHSPNQTVLNVARGNLLHHMIYNRSRELLNYSGCPDERGATTQVNGNYSCDFFVIFPTRGLGSDTVRIGFRMTTWDNSDSTDDCDFEWDGVASVKLADMSTVSSTGQELSIEMSEDVKPQGETYTDDIQVDYDSRDFTGYSYAKISFEHLQPASFVSWIMPDYESDFNAIDTQTGDQVYNLTDSTFNIGQPLRGSNAIADGNGSVGTLCQRQFNDGTTDQNMINNSDLCLFQWGHPAGLEVTGGGIGSNDQDAFGYNIKIKGRQLKHITDAYFDLAIIYRADTGTTLKVTVDSTAVTHSIGLSTATGATPNKLVAFTDIPFDGSGDELTIECVVSNSASVEIKSIAIFEKGDG